MTDSDRIAALLNDYQSALAQFDAALKRKSDDPLIHAGTIQYFEFCFELAWKSIQRIASVQGLKDCNSPKACLQQAFAMGWIDDEVPWLEMLDARNRISHTYSHREAEEVYGKCHGFKDGFQNLLNHLIRVTE
jgi:nucleotidyltransferase substrate binding protein (TIGR01987 family)